MFVHCSSFVRHLFVICSFFVRHLFVICSSFVRHLFVICSSFVRLLFVFCSSFVRLLFVHCSSYFSVTTLPLLGSSLRIGNYVIEERIFYSSFVHYLPVRLAPARALHRCLFVYMYKLCQSFKSLAKLKSTNNLLFIFLLSSTFLLLRFVVPSFIVRLLFVVEPL